MDIKVGDYIRTKKNGIKKVDRINEKATKNKYIVYYGIDKEGDECYITINIDDIISHNEYLIDLIEVGDIVNNQVVIKSKDINKCNSIRLSDNSLLENKDIKIITTKEQLKENCYKVEE